MFTDDGLSGVIGDKVVLAVEGWGDGVMGDKFVGEVTERVEMLSESDELRSMDVSPIED